MPRSSPISGETKRRGRFISLLATFQRQSVVSLHSMRCVLWGTYQSPSLPVSRIPLEALLDIVYSTTACLFLPNPCAKQVRTERRWFVQMEMSVVCTRSLQHTSRTIPNNALSAVARRTAAHGVLYYHPGVASQSRVYHEILMERFRPSGITRTGDHQHVSLQNSYDPCTHHFGHVSLTATSSLP